MLTKEQLAARLTGREYPFSLTNAEAREAKEAGLVVLYGASDDLAEFEGAISDEVGAGDDKEIQVNAKGVVPEIDRDEEEILEKYGVLEQVQQSGRKITAFWDRGDYSWQYETDIPHATFEIAEDGAKYCRGIVFALADLRT